MKRGVEARVAAAELVMRVMDDGAYSNVLARRLVDDHDDATAGHAQRLAMDALRRLHAIDIAIAESAGRPIETLDRPVRALLRVGGAELAGDAPAHAAVDCAVEASRHLGAARAAPFVNGVMRRLAERRPETSPESETPAWMLERLSAAWDADAAVAFFAGSAGIPRPAVRWRRPPLPHEPSGVPGAGYVASDALEDLVRSGDAMVADPASTAVGLAVAAQPGETILDVAAAPGGKTAHLWDQMRGEGVLVAADVHQRRLGTTRRRLGRAGVHPVYVVADGSRAPFREGTFDRVLLDAPCTGLGTIRRRPEIRHRLRPDAPRRYGGLQRKLLGSALRLVRPGGRVVYSVCTVFPEETVDVVAGLDAAPPAGLPGMSWGDGLLMAPHLTGTDGMFIAVITRPR